MSDHSLATVDALLAVVDAGGFGRAARELGITQSAVSRRVTRLESRLGIRLLFRTTRNVSLTAAGETFVHEARRAVALLAAAEADCRAGQDQVAGLVRVTAPTAFGRACLVPALKRLTTAHPALHLDLQLSDRYVDLQTGAVDLAIRFSDDVPSGWLCEALGPVKVRLCASPNYLATHGSLTRTADLARHRTLAVRTYDTRTKWPFFEDGRRIEVDVSPYIVVSDFSALGDMVVRGMGVSILPHYIADRCIANGDLVEVMPGCVRFDVTLFASRPSHMRNAARVQAVLEALHMELDLS